MFINELMNDLCGSCRQQCPENAFSFDVALKERLASRDEMQFCH